jgi:hypothetical protein
LDDHNHLTINHILILIFFYDTTSVCPTQNALIIITITLVGARLGFQRHQRWSSLSQPQHTDLKVETAFLARGA